MGKLAKSALRFVAIGLALYAAAGYASERLLYRTGHTNPFYKIVTTSQRDYDWVILGASHAMPLDFADFNSTMEVATGLRILNLATPGNGVLYNRFVLERFLDDHRAARVLYVLDSFSFYSSTWNEERFADTKLLRRTPLDGTVARRLAAYCIRYGVSPLALLDYLSGFSKINNRERFQADVWEGEAQFDRVYRPSASADKQRIAYLYPDGTADAAAFARYLGQFAEFVAFLQSRGIELVVMKTPVPPAYRQLLPNEDAFDQAVGRVLSERRVPYRDFSADPTEPGSFFDTDHLNRKGLNAFFEQRVKPILAGSAAATGEPAKAERARR